MITYQEFKDNLRDISFMDKVKSLIFKHPSFNHYCEYYDEQITKFLDDKSVYVKEVGYHNTVLCNSEGKCIDFWTSNYPHSYGNIDGHLEQPSWGNVFKIRQFQLSKKQVLLDKFKKDNMV